MQKDKLVYTVLPAMKIVVLLCIVLCNYACTENDSDEASEVEDEDVTKGGVDILNPDYKLVDVYYGTDRKINAEQSDSVKQYYIGERGKFTYGICKISIPKGHKVGELESPSVFKFEFTEDPALHVVLLDIQQLAQNEYFKTLAKIINSSSKKQAFIFVHGYNVTFEDAARRTAQMAYDLQFNGAPILYSWPSVGTLAGYPKDEGNVEWTVPHLREFIKDVVERTQAEQIHLVAHSMGNRALTRVLIEAKEYLNSEQLATIKQIILTAPDVDAEVFKRDIAPRITAFNSDVTLYVSDKDKALEASKKYKGYSRAGDSGQNIVLVDGVETIDASEVSTGFLAHSYYSEEVSVLKDIRQLISDGLSAQSRNGLEQVTVAEEGMQYWKIKSTQE